MGSFGSKTLLSQIVTIFGYNSNDFDWREANDRIVYQTTGLICSYGDKKYVLTIRSRMISCKNIVMYHSNFIDEKIDNNISIPVMRNDLEILFQSIENDIIILGSRDKLFLDLNKSEMMTNHYNLSHQTIKSYAMDNPAFKNIVPTKRSQYYTVIMDVDLENKNNEINYLIHMFDDLKYIKSYIDTNTFLPSNFFHRFEFNKISSVQASMGAVIFNRKKEVIGMIMDVRNQIYLKVLPFVRIRNLVEEFVKYHQQPTSYLGLLGLPINYNAKENDNGIELIEDLISDSVIIKKM